MTLRTLIDTASTHGATLSVVDGKLSVRRGRGVPPAVLEEIAAKTQQLIWWLTDDLAHIPYVPTLVLCPAGDHVPYAATVLPGETRQCQYCPACWEEAADRALIHPDFQWSDSTRKGHLSYEEEHCHDDPCPD